MRDCKYLTRCNAAEYVWNMKAKTYSNEFRSRSEFLEHAARVFLAHLARVETERRDLEIINRNAESLNAEAADVLAYQVPL